MLATMRLAVGMQEKPAWPRRWIVCSVALAATPGFFGARLAAADSQVPVMFSAASTAIPLGVLAESFERTNGRHVKLSLAASSTLARQIILGAPASIFLSANTQWMDRLEEAGLLAEESRRALLSNRLVLIARKNSDKRVRLADPESLQRALDGFPLVMADPAHVPAGMYAREALERLGLWDRLDGHLAFVPNARAVTVRVARGEAPLGITYASELKGMSDLTVASAISAQMHSPIRYELALVAEVNDPAALAFYEYLLTEDARAVFRKHGFPPGNEGVAPSSKERTPSLPAPRAGRPLSQQ